MSLESQIAELVSATNALVTTFNGKKKEIDLAVAAAVVAIPQLRKSWYVDENIGLDLNDGSVRSPFKTIGKALSATPDGGVCIVQLLSDYVLDQGIPTGAKYLIVSSSGGTRRKLKPRYFNYAGEGIESWIGGFVVTSGSMGVDLRDIELEMPTSAKVTPVPTSSRVTSVLRTNDRSDLPALASFTLNNSNVTMAAGDFIGNLAGAKGCLVLSVTQSTFPADFGGKYISGVASGSNANTIASVITNLNTL